MQNAIFHVPSTILEQYLEAKTFFSLKDECLSGKKKCIFFLDCDQQVIKKFLSPVCNVTVTIQNLFSMELSAK